LTEHMVTIASLVEGEGEVAALPKVLHRLAAELDVTLLTPTPWRKPRSRLVTVGGIEREISAMASRAGPSGGVLVVVDADDACPAKLAPDLLARARAARPGLDIGVVLANREFEAWFLAAAPSLAGRHGFPEGLKVPSDPEAVRGAKEWLTRHRESGHPYKPAVDQAALASTFDIKQARSNSPSFDKLCRDVEGLIRRVARS
jgi:hypothetical protein